MTTSSRPRRISSGLRRGNLGVHPLSRLPLRILRATPTKALILHPTIILDWLITPLQLKPASRPLKSSVLTRLGVPSPLEPPSILNYMQVFFPAQGRNRIVLRRLLPDLLIGLAILLRFCKGPRQRLRSHPPRREM